MGKVKEKRKKTHQKRPQRTGEISKQSAHQDVWYVKKLNYWCGKIHKLEVEFRKEFSQKVPEQRNDADMCALIADGILREQEFQFHPVWYRAYMKNCKFDSQIH